MLIVRTKVAPSPVHGLGCFAQDDIRAGEVVWTYYDGIDTRISLAEMETLPEVPREFLLNFGYMENVDNQKVFTLNGDNAKYMNHSETPNLTEHGATNRAARDIKAGEELTCNYFEFDLDAERKLGSASSDNH